jgi:ketosteroid isomerase-like protein
VPQDYVDLVRRLWEAFERGGIDAVVDIADPDVEWEPYHGGGTVYRGHEGLRAYMQRRADQAGETDAQLYSAFAKGDFVVARGEVRVRGPQGITTAQPGWLYEFRDGKLIRFRGFPTQEAALRAAGLAPDEPVAVVREIWAAFNKGAVDTILALTDPQVELRPYDAQRDLYVGHDGVRELLAEALGADVDANVTEYAFSEVGDAVVVSGSLQVVDASGAIAAQQVHWVYRVKDGLVHRADSFARREQALHAATSGATV